MSYISFVDRVINYIIAMLYSHIIVYKTTFCWDTMEKMRRVGWEK